MPPEKPKKRLVSKGEFAISVTKEVVFTMAGFGLIIAGCSGSFFSIVLAIGIAIGGSGIDPELRGNSLVFLFVAVVSAIVAYAGFALTKTANAMQSLAPITRDNVARLPAAESLVRPSSADAIPQEQVLLRATMATDETPSKELLRPQDTASAETTLESGRLT